MIKTHCLSFRNQCALKVNYFLSWWDVSRLSSLEDKRHTYTHVGRRKRQENMGKLIQFIEHILFVGLPSWHWIIECGDEADIGSLYTSTNTTRKHMSDNIRCVNFVCMMKDINRICLSQQATVYVCSNSIDLKYLMNWWTNYRLSHVEMLCEW